MKKIDYHYPRLTLILTFILFITQSVPEYLGIITRKPGFEWLGVTFAIMFFLAILISLVVCVINAKLVTTEKRYFPITVLYTDTGERAICYTPEDIKNGESFKVIETNKE